jgi:hypothetical protein
MKKSAALLSVVLFAGGLSTVTLAPSEVRADEPMTPGTISKIDHSTGKIELNTG